MRILHWVYPALVGLLLGALQTGLYFQLSFTLSSSFTTFLMVTLCWLIGSAIGVRLLQRMRFPLNGFLLLALLAYFACVIMLNAAPFNTQLWPLYALLIIITGLYPGIFFARFGSVYRARELFFRENNGFILGLISSTFLFLLFGRAALWVTPILMSGIVFFSTKPSE
ncbi:MAG: hypothetical protein GC204_18740 [Chloroflexi bacterium]|nr:hypothetical protein [Chloroflexota bacterium]